MIQYNYLYKVKYSNLRENLTLVEKLNKQNLRLRVNVVPMKVISEFKQFLKEHGVKYSYYRNMPDTVIVNTSNFPRLVFQFEEFDILTYCKVTTIPKGNWTFDIPIYDVKELLIGMLRFNLIDINTVKRLYKYELEKKKIKKINKVA